MADETVLSLLGLGVPPYSARGLTQTLEPLDQATSLARTINGELIDLSRAEFRKYKSTISGTDQRPPSCDGLWPGRQIVVDCIEELAYADGGTPQRPVVEGSSFSESGFTYYRPRLTMVVTDFQLSRDEYGAQVAWSMTLEEK
jgi:hypothetical protein